MAQDNSFDLEQYLNMLRPRDPFEEEAIREFNAMDHLLDDPFSLMAPPFERPVETVNKLLAQKRLKLNVTHGTTTVGFKYQGGIIMAADSRGSHTNNVISHHIHKIVELNEHMLSTIAGGAADCAYWNRVLMRECRLHYIREDEHMHATQASRVMNRLLRVFRGKGFAMGMMIAGYDYGGARLYHISADIGREEGNIFTIGSGQTNALNKMDFDYNWDMTDKEAYKLACYGVCEAGSKDPYTGGYIQVYHITPAGWKLVDRNEYIEIVQSVVPESITESGNL